MTAAERQAMVRAIRKRNPKASVRSIQAELAAAGCVVSVGTVHRDLNPKAAKRYRRASREHRRKQKQERSSAT